MYHVSKLICRISVVLLGSTILLSCNHPHATQMDVRVSLGRGVDINWRGHNRATALHNAAARGDAAVVETLLSQISEGDRLALIHQSNNDGATAFHIAAFNGRVAVVNSLLHLWADIHQRNNEGGTALHYAARRGHAAVVNKIINSEKD